MVYISSLRELDSVSQLIANVLNILGTATQDYPRRISVMHSIWSAYCPVQAPEHLEPSTILGYIKELESARFVMPAPR